MATIEARLQRLQKCRGQPISIDLPIGAAPGDQFQGLAQLPVLGAHGLALVVPGRMDPVEQLVEADLVAARARREIGARRKRREVARIEKQGQRPTAAAAGQQLMRELVETVEVRTLLAIDLDADEPGVEPARDVRIVEALASHDLAPVAGRVAYRQQDRSVLGPRTVQRAAIPGLPVDGLVGVLLQVGAERVG